MSKKSKPKQEQVETKAAEIEPVEQEQEEVATVESEEELTEVTEIEPVEQEVLDDDPTLVKLTVLIVCTETTGRLLRYVLRSLSNLRGVEAEVKVTGKNKPTCLPHETFISVEGETFADIIREALATITTERVIIMDDHMMIATPVTLADIAINKALPEPPSQIVKDVLADLYDYHGRVENYDKRTPLYAFTREVIKTLSPHLPAAVDFRVIYCNLIYRDVRPMLLNWQNDPWVLPIVSSRPSPSVALKYAQKKKFLWVKECNDFICTEILERIFPAPIIKKEDETHQQTGG